MPPVDIHIKNSKERTGKGFEELHYWIDNDKLKALETHNISKIPENIRYVLDNWGEEAVSEFVLHIKDDMEQRMKENLQYFGLFK